MFHRVNLASAALFGLVLIATVAIYLPGLNGGFNLDDYHNIVENPAFQKESWGLADFYKASVSQEAGPLGRPVSNFTFAVDAWLHDLNPYYMKLVNLGLHLLVGLLVYWVALQVISVLYGFEDRTYVKWLATVAAAIWLLHPIHSSTVLYVVQRMAILSALFGMAAIGSYISARQSPSGRKASLWLVAHIALVSLAAFSKENGLLVLPIVLLLEFCVFRSKSNAARPQTIVQNYILINSALCLMAAAFVVWQFDGLTGSYAYRDFTLVERILTQSRVIWHYISLLLYPVPGRFSLYKDGFSVSTGFFDPASTAFAVGGVAVLLLSAVYLSARHRSLIGFAVLWFFVAHSLESTLFPLEIIFEHRNYFPTVGIAIAVPALVASMSSGKLRERVQMWLFVPFGLVLAGSTYVVSTFWANPLEHALISAHLQPESPRAQYAAGSVYAGLVREQEAVTSREGLKDYVLAAKRAENYLLASANLSEEAIAPLVQLIILYGDVPDSAAVLERVEQRLGTMPLRPGAGNELYRLLQCQRRGRCKFPPELLMNAFMVGTQNEKATKQIRATCHLLVASVLAVELDDRARAKWHMDRAEALLPNAAWVQRELDKFRGSP